MSIERIKNNLGYSPENCRWATCTEQNRNRRVNRYLTFHGETLCVAAWAEKLGISVHTLRDRVYRGWPVERILGGVRK